MQTEQDRQKHFKDEEVDLSFIYRNLYLGFRRVGQGVSNAFRTILYRKWLVLGCVLIGVALGYALKKASKPYYNSSMTLVLANIRNEFIEDQLNKLSELIYEENFDAVAERMDITPDAARQIREMKFTNLDQDRIEEDSVLTGSPFRIELSLFDPQLFIGLEPALTEYLENNRYFARQKRIRQRQVESMITKLKGEINSIDSIKTNVSEPRGPVNGFIYGQPIDPTNLYRESISMYKEQVELEADLEKLANVEIVTGFIPRVKPTGPKAITYGGIGGLIGLLIGLVIALSLEKPNKNRA
ncbi:chain length determinant protein [Pontibacter amylolyticus]|uniref:Chain length determinant protein n=1 Tax=Pontibacter amylolyticus TaxID=1424080 RepID=A0ABQ1WDR5_9BACT|nr:chain length determinant protein [Pontibacter amylolyticus]GGG26979.1 hypothetical protein GCM10011323_33160 [Pontibacter amylolyticus]